MAIRNDRRSRCRTLSFPHIPAFSPDAGQDDGPVHRWTKLLRGSTALMFECFHTYLQLGSCASRGIDVHFKGVAIGAVALDDSPCPGAIR